MSLFAATSARIRRTATPPRRAARAGLSIPIVTVLDRNGRVLADEQRAVVRYAAQEGSGADIVFAAGTTGEWDKLDNPRRQLVARITVEECRRSSRGSHAVEAWVGITARTRGETLANLDHALDIGADAAVVAPLSISDVLEPADFVIRDISALFGRRGRRLPLFLHDNADFAAPGKAPHLHTRDIKKMSRLDYVRGVTVTAGKMVLGNYTRAAAHFKRRGQFGLYPGNAYLIFDLFAAPAGVGGRMRHYWNRYLTHNALPDGIVASAANVMPREWQRAWQVCRASETPLMERYGLIMNDFRTACDFSRAGKPHRPTVACLKAALSDMGVCTSDAVASGTAPLQETERREFLRRFKDIRRRAAATLEPEWLSEWSTRPALWRARRDG
ncbi:MAG: dihydrodipicolinate synthase family protein [Candidatus Binataceae bacterium]